MEYIRSGMGVYLTSMANKAPLKITHDGVQAIDVEGHEVAPRVMIWSRGQQDLEPLRDGDEIILGSFLHPLFPRHFNERYLHVDGSNVTSKTGRDFMLIIHKVGSNPGDLIYDGDRISFLMHTGHALHVIGDRVTTLPGAPGTLAQQFIVSTPQLGSLHQVVGQDGVLLLTSATKTQGEQHALQDTLQALRKASIEPLPMWAGASQTPGTLQLSCPLQTNSGTANWCQAMGKVGQPGCADAAEQGRVDAHRQAWLAAINRAPKTWSHWTAILEDTVRPVDPDSFNSNFEKAWARVPKTAKLVRLQYCSDQDDDANFSTVWQDTTVRGASVLNARWWTDTAGDRHYFAGDCMAGYLVHRTLLKELLGMFPCCCALECCLQQEVLFRLAKNPRSAQSDSEMKRWRATEIMVDLDMEGSGELSADLVPGIVQGGLFAAYPSSTEA